MKTTLDYKILDEMPSEMKHRLLLLIESHSEYFTLTGSDPLDLSGCCPSDGVRAANRLVEAGVLQVVQSKSAQNSCPVNIYAFSGEIKGDCSEPEFSINQEFRQKIERYLTKNKSKKRLEQSVLRWSLLLFVALSLGVFARTLWNNHISTKPLTKIDLSKEFALPFQEGLLILQFHRTQRCKFCTNMENHTRETLNTYFLEDIRDKKIVFRTVDMEQPKYKSLIKKYNIFTSSIVLIDVFENKELRWELVPEAWRQTNKKQKFIEMLRLKIDEFRIGQK